MKRYLTILMTLPALPALAACGATAVATASLPPAHHSPARCGARKGHTLAANPAARVYVLHGVVYGCAGNGGHPYRLGFSRRCPLSTCVGRIVLAGPLVAYEEQDFGVDTVGAGIDVRDLRDGKLRVQDPAVSNVPGPESFAGVEAIVLRRDGAVAWIGEVSSVGHPNTVYEVHRVDSTGQTLLDSGAKINAKSLRLHGATITWSDGGHTHSATLA